jgi:hypothetical protein
LPQNARIHDIFHVSLLKKFEGTSPATLVPLPDILRGKVIPTPDKLLKAQLNRGVWEIQVQWVGHAASDVLWEDLQEFKQRYPQVQLAGELFVGEGGSVVDSFLRRHYRRPKEGETTISG